MEAWLLSDPDGERLGPLCLKSADLPRQRRQFCNISSEHSVETGQHRSEILFDANRIAFACLHHRRHRSHMRPRLLASDVQPVLTPKRDRPHAIFHPVVIHLDAPVAHDQLEPLPQLQRVLARSPLPEIMGCSLLLAILRKISVDSQEMIADISLASFVGPISLSLSP